MRVCQPFFYCPVISPYKRMNEIDQELEGLQGNEAKARDNINGWYLRAEGFTTEIKGAHISCGNKGQRAIYTKIADLYAERVVLASKQQRDLICVMLAMIVFTNLINAGSLIATASDTITTFSSQHTYLMGFASLLTAATLLSIGFLGYTSAVNLGNQVIMNPLNHRKYMESAKFAYGMALPKSKVHRTEFAKNVAQQFNEKGWSRYFAPSSIFPVKRATAQAS